MGTTVIEWIRVLPGRWKALLVLFASGAACACSYAVLVYWIDAHMPAPSGAIYYRPYRIRVGQALSMPALVKRLDRLGYRRADFQADDDWYVQSGNRIFIAQHTPEGRQKFEIAFADTPCVAGIFRDSRPVDVVALKPDVLSNVIGASRTKKRDVRFDDLPQHLVQAVLVAEDAQFFAHPGLNLFAVVRAVLVDLKHFDLIQGGSTLTQQFVKNQFLSSEKRFSRKLVEIAISLVLENRFSKEDIFTFYANSVYLGQVGAFGISGFGQAAETFFGKPVKDLTLPESALLAGVIRAPNPNSPYRHPEDALVCRNRVLAQMAQHGMISEAEKDAACRAPLGLKAAAQQPAAEAPYFVDYVQQVAKKDLADSLRIGGAQIYTTLDRDLQRAAFDAVREGMAQVDRLVRVKSASEKPEAALVAVDPKNGDILAMIGGRDYAISPFNRAVQALRQPGSAFKPFVYAAALQQGLVDTATAPYTLSSHLMDAPQTFSFGDTTYAPGNYHGIYYGSVTVRTALALSLNVPTVALAEGAHLDRVEHLARTCGFGEPLRPYPSLALGAFEVRLLDLAQGYVPFADGGRSIPLHGISRVICGDDDWRVSRADTQRVLQPEVAFLVTSALTSVIESGTGRGVRERGFDLPVAGKTGTATDSWFVGYTPDLLCAVWVGFDDARPLSLSGAQAALPIWTAFMLKAQHLGALSGRDFPIPDGIVAVKIDPETGMRAGRRCPDVQTEYYIAGTEPTQTCQVHGLHLWRWLKAALPW